MFEEILSPAAIDIIQSTAQHIDAFYLAGETALALQLGHRKSDDFDFFSNRMLNTDSILARISVDIENFEREFRL